MSDHDRTNPQAQVDNAPTQADGAAGAASALVYCRCAYARVVPLKVKDGVLEALAASGVDFDAAPDLCEMSARRDPRLKEIAGAGRVTIAACYPRAVRWLFNDAGSPLDTERVTILNMREQSAEEVASAMLNGAGGGSGNTAPGTGGGK